MKLCTSLYGIDLHNTEDKFKIPFKYNLDNQKDIDRIIEYLTNPLLHHDEYSEIMQLKDELDSQISKKTLRYNFDLYDFSWENIISNKNNEEANQNCDDFIAQQALENINDVEKFTNIITSANDQKRIILKTAKLSFILHLKKTMKTMIIIFHQMNKDEFVEKFKLNFSEQLLSPYRFLKNDQYVEDKHQTAIDNYTLKIESDFLN